MQPHLCRTRISTAMVFTRLQNRRFFLKISKEIGKACRKSLTREAREPLFSASFQTFCLTARAYLNTQKYGLFRSLGVHTTPAKFSTCVTFV